MKKGKTSNKQKYKGPLLDILKEEQNYERPQYDSWHFSRIIELVEK